jgi:crotonobetainyl-CoA:carnitine CoA-transferase CaiB-like acyl-CoA transferase
MGVLAAVIKRQQTGEGSFVDISMTDAAFALNAMAGAACLAGGQEQVPEGGMLNGGSFYDYYQTSDGRWLSVGSLEPQFSARLLDTLGLGELKKFAMSQRPEDQQELKDAIKGKIVECSLSYWRAVFAHVDACVEPVLTMEEAAEHEQLKERGMVREVDRGDGELQRQISFPIKFNAGTFEIH